MYHLVRRTNSRIVWGHAFLPVASGMSVVHGPGLTVRWCTTLETTLYENVIIVQRRVVLVLWAKEWAFERLRYKQKGVQWRLFPHCITCHTANKYLPGIPGTKSASGHLNDMNPNKTVVKQFICFSCTYTLAPPTVIRQQCIIWEGNSYGQQAYDNS